MWRIYWYFQLLVKIIEFKPIYLRLFLPLFLSLMFSIRSFRPSYVPEQTFIFPAYPVSLNKFKQSLMWLINWLNMKLCSPLGNNTSFPSLYNTSKSNKRIPRWRFETRSYVFNWLRQMSKPAKSFSFVLFLEHVLDNRHIDNIKSFKEAQEILTEQIYTKHKPLYVFIQSFYFL